ncbi:hypothetical protein IAU60_006654 [Kwoniella sp. DSM 27419]
MQVEYETSSPAVGGVLDAGEDSMMHDEGVSVQPGLEGGDSDEEHEQEQAGEEEEDEAVEQGQKTKAKRTIKQRQSLAEKQPGTTIFPMSRIKRIVKADKDLENMSNEAVFLVAVATEYFIKHFMEEGYTKARLEKRKIVNYKDMAAVVARSEEFDFLKDVIPPPMSMSEALERRKQKFSADENPTLHDDDVPQTSNQQAMNDDDLPPLAPSTNPLFPNAIMKKPPNTHAKTSREPRQSRQDSAAETPVTDPAAVAALFADATGIAIGGAGLGAEGGKPPAVASPRVLTGKNAPTTPHGLTTRGAARRSLAGTDVEMSPVQAIRREDEELVRESVAATSEREEDDHDGDAQMA